MSDLINMFIINTYNHIFVCNSYKTNEMFMPSSKKTLHHHDGKKYFVKMMTALACHLLGPFVSIGHQHISLQLIPCDLLKGFSKFLKARLYLMGFIIKYKWSQMACFTQGAWGCNTFLSKCQRAVSNLQDHFFTL